MDKERKLYNKFLDKLDELLNKPNITDKELRIILNFLANQNIQANPETNEGLQSLMTKIENELPFDVEELDVRRG